MARFIYVVAALCLAACGKDNNADGRADGGDSPDMGMSGDVFVPADWGDAGPMFDGELARTLPLEVLGRAGTEVTIELELDGLEETDDVTLQLTLANVALEDSAEVEVNGTYVVSLADEGSRFVRPTGGWAESAVPLDARQFRNGPNYLTFRWTGESEEIAGFRVVAVSLEYGDSAATFETWDDPSAWAPSDASPEAVERGRRYFQNVSPNGGPVCAECHTTSGADLQYYAYSDAAIAAYAAMLGFEDNEAADLTSYIRSLDVGRDGRPWVAPFQPGMQNYGAAGAGVAGVVTDAEVREAWLPGALPSAIEWDHAAEFDPYRVPSTFQATTWNRWLPRQIDFDWFDRAGGTLDAAIGAYDDDPTIDTAHALLEAAVTVGAQLGAEGEHQSRIDLMRWASVKLWDWSRTQSFYEPHHGFPDEPWGSFGEVGSPAYMSEVGFALSDAAGAGVPFAKEEALRWWLAQMAADYGRGRSTGLRRPLDFHALLTGAQGIAAPNEMAWFYVLGSWEESRGDLIDMWGTSDGPVRLLPAALPYVPPELLPLLWRRFVNREAEHAIGGGSFTPEHLNLFQRAWTATCAQLDDNTREQLVATTPDALRDSIICD